MFETEIKMIKKLFNIIVDFFKDKWVKRVLVFFVIVYTIIIIQKHYEQKDIDENTKTTTAKVIRFWYKGKSLKNKIDYVYYAPNKINGYAACIDDERLIEEATKQGYPDVVGAIFKVEYSAIEPANSRLIVGDMVCH